jgi:predicted Zn-dependent protease
MYGEDKIKSLLKEALKASPADQTEVLISAEDSYLTRFANSYIHQNVGERNCSLTVRAVFGRKIGIASTNILGREEIRRTVKQACAIARIQKDNPEFVSLPRPVQDKSKPLNLYIRRTAEYSARQRALAVKKICDQANKFGAKAYGAFSTGVVELGIANSLGILQYNISTDANINTVVMTPTGSGYGQGASRDAGKIDIQGIAESAVQKAVDSQNPTELEPGSYTVVMEDMAVLTLLEFMNFAGFSAMAAQEEHSFIANNLDKQIVGQAVTISDNPFNKNGFAFPFDFEGVSKQKVVLIDKGVARSVVYDSYTANKQGRSNTGHALPAPAYYPLAANLEMEGGDSSLEKMVASTDRGVYITRFHYCNLIDPMQVSITGMTRDGTFLIENGKITKPVKNLRFTESVLKALSNVKAVSKKVSLVTEGGGYGHRFAVGSLVPSLKIEEFNFTGKTEF